MAYYDKFTKPFMDKIVHVYLDLDYVLISSH